MKLSSHKNIRTNKTIRRGQVSTRGNNVEKQVESEYRIEKRIMANSKHKQPKKMSREFDADPTRVRRKTRAEY